MPTVDGVKSQILQLWTIQSNILLMYRSICLTALSVLAVAVIFLLPRASETFASLGLFIFSLLVFFFLVAGAGFITFIWNREQRARGADVDYLHTRALWADCADPSVVAGHRVIEGLERWRGRTVADKCEQKAKQCAIFASVVDEIKKNNPGQEALLESYARTLSTPDRTRKDMKCVARGFYVLWASILVYGILAYWHAFWQLQ